MARTAYTTVDRFAADLDSMLREVADKVGSGLEPAVRASCRLAVKEASKGAEVFEPTPYPGLSKGPYKDGFDYKMTGRKDKAGGEVGNRLYPGLVHLLEKGHAIMGGGRARAFEHVAPAADKAFDDLERRIGQAIDRGVG